MNLLETALELDDLDAALEPIQRALGIEAGDVAMTAANHTAWRVATRRDRGRMLARWLRIEIIYAV